MGANDGGIKRGDRADTGPLEAGHKDGVGRGGSGLHGGDGGSQGFPTGAADSLAEPMDIMDVTDEDLVETEGDIDNLYVTKLTDPKLGLTGVAGHRPKDRIANSGPTKNPEAEALDKEILKPKLEAPDRKRSRDPHRKPKRK